VIAYPLRASADILTGRYNANVHEAQDSPFSVPDVTWQMTGFLGLSLWTLDIDLGSFIVRATGFSENMDADIEPALPLKFTLAGQAEPGLG
jgi:hypothetical protein